MAANDKITIKFVPEGDERLIKAFEGLAKGQRKFNQQNKKGADGLKKYNRNQMRVTKGNQALGGSFAVIRSKMLLFNFAMALGVRQLTGFAKEAAKVKSMETAFTNMSGSVRGAEQRLKALKSATNNTMSEFDLFQQANNAMVLGLTRNTDEMANMFDSAQRLGRALGRDTKSSVESLVTGIGRQSRLMLDNIGIIVKTDKAYEKYAASLKKTASQLTEAEKKQAFFNAAMEAAEQKLLILGDEIPTSQDALDGMDASIKNMSDNIGKAFLPMLESTASLLSSLAEAFDTRRAKSYLAAIVGMGSAMAIYVAHLKRAVILQTMTGWGAMATGIGIVSAELLNMSGLFEDGNKTQEDARAKVVAYTESLMDMQQAQLQVELSDARAAALRGMTVTEYKAIKSELDDVTNKINVYNQQVQNRNIKETDYIRDARILQSVLESKLNVEGEATEQQKAMIQLMSDYIETIKDTGFSLNDLSTTQEKVATLYASTSEAQKANIADNIKFIEGLNEATISAENKAAILKMLQAQYDKTGGKVKIVTGHINQLASALSSAERAGTHMGMAVENALKGIASQIISQMAVYSLAATFLPSLGLAKGFGAALKFGLGIAHTGGHIKEDGSVQRFATGGVVQGQDNVPILAQAGEFVMRRSAVESVGLEAMNRINAGGSAGNVVINVSGNVMSQDYVEGELANQLKEAIRRGADIGVS